MKVALVIILLIVLILVIVLTNKANPDLAPQLRIFDITDDLPKGPGSYRTRNLEDITEIILHHSAVEGQGPEDYARYHTSSRGWPGIGYHFVIQPDGTVYQTNRLETISYHCSGVNSRSVGVCLSGDFTDHLPAETQLSAAQVLIVDLRSRLPGGLAVKRHSDYGATGCPGRVEFHLLA